MKRGLNKENSLPDPEFGGESSESARAIHYVVQKDTLMTYEKGLFAQADPGIVSGSTIERKQMSTKTIYKRIALVAVTALGAGVLSVAPASAAATIGTITVADQSVSCFVGDTCKALVSVTTSAAGPASASADDVITLTTASVTAVTGATAIAKTTDVAEGGAATASTKFALRVAGAGASLATTVSTVMVPSVVSSKLTLTPANSAAAGTYASGQFEFLPNTPGTYTFSITPAAAGDGETNVAGTITVKVLSLGAKIGDGGAVLTPFNAVNGVAGANNYVTLQANGMARTSGALGTQVEVTGGTVISASAGTVSTDKTKILIAGVTHATDPSTASTILVATPTVGTITVKTYVETAAGVYSATADNTVTITVAAAAQTGTLSVANSTSIIDASSPASFNASADETVLVSKTQSTPTATEVASIKVTLKDTLNNTMPNTTSLSATISGPGSLSIGSSQPTDATGRAVSATTSSGIAYVNVYADGTEGVATITLTVGTTTVATETVTFYGTATKYVAVVKKAHIANSGSSTADVIEVTATDKGGNLVPSAVIGASVGTSTIATVVSSATTASTGKALFAMTGLATKFGSVVVTFADSATAPTVTTTATVGVSSVLAKTVAAAVTAAPTPGAPITWTLTFKDANGLGLPDGDYAAGTLLANSAANPVASASLASTPFAGNATISLVAGVATAKGFAPLTSGPVSYTWTLAGTAGAADTANLVTALQATTVTASTTVTQNADISAITTLINSLIAKINALSKLVTKIQKKVRA
jgi:trimeric autotransporter adhesin